MHGNIYLEDREGGSQQSSPTWRWPRRSKYKENFVIERRESYMSVCNKQIERGQHDWWRSDILFMLSPLIFGRHSVNYTAHSSSITTHTKREEKYHLPHEKRNKNVHKRKKNHCGKITANTTEKCREERRRDGERERMSNVKERKTNGPIHKYIYFVHIFIPIHLFPFIFQINLAFVHFWSISMVLAAQYVPILQQFMCIYVCVLPLYLLSVVECVFYCCRPKRKNKER